MEKNQNTWNREERRAWANELSKKYTQLLSEGYSQIKNEREDNIIGETVKVFCKAASLKDSALWGNDTEEEIKSKLEEALEQKFPPSFPEDLGESIIASWSRVCMITLGTFFGMVLGSLIFGFFFGEAKTGILAGGLIFSGLTAYFLMDEKQFESRLNKICWIMGIWFLIDVFSKVFRKKKENILPTAPKIAVQATPFIMKFLIKKEFNVNSCQKSLQCIFENWLAAVDVVGTQIYNQETAKTISSEDKEREKPKVEIERAAKAEKRLDEFVAALLTANTATDQNRIDLIDDLKSRAEGMGYSSPAMNVPGKRQKRTEIWREEMLESYEPFGAVETGDEVEIVEEFVSENGAVRKKGIVTRRRNSSK